MPTGFFGAVFGAAGSLGPWGFRPRAETSRLGPAGQLPGWTAGKGDGSIDESEALHDSNLVGRGDRKGFGFS